MCCSPWGHKGSDTTEGLNRTKKASDTLLTSYGAECAPILPLIFQQFPQSEHPHHSHLFHTHTYVCTHSMQKGIGKLPCTCGFKILILSPHNDTKSKVLLAPLKIIKVRHREVQSLPRVSELESSKMRNSNLQFPRHIPETTCTSKERENGQESQSYETSASHVDHWCYLDDTLPPKVYFITCV